MKILILASNPRKDLNLDGELRIVQSEIDRAAKRDQFPIVKEVGVEVGDLQRLVLQHKPEIIHFCGHGSGEEGLIFKVKGGGEQRVQASALADLFRLNKFVKCVLLNACYSEEQATAIAQHTDYVIGMSNTIQDKAAIAFSKGFYTALGNDCSIELSFEFGKNAIQLEVSESSIKRSSAAAVEERKAEVVGVIETTELKEHEKPRIFIRGKEQTTSDLDQSRSNQFISDAKREEVLLKIDASLSPSIQLAIQAQTFSFQIATVTVKRGRIFGKPSIEISHRDGTAECFEEKLDKDTSLVMVKIPGGKFIMGTLEDKKNKKNEEAGRTPAENSQHMVDVPTFYMGKYVVSQSQWFSVAKKLAKVEIDLIADPSQPDKDRDYPVDNVSWEQATEFCARLSRQTGKSYRLPSEAEWEYACRSGTNTPFHFGATITSDLVNCNATDPYGDAPKGEYRKRKTVIGSFPPNAFGLYDIHGNVWEWCTDNWHDNYTGAPDDGSAWLEDGDKPRVRRGGSWLQGPSYCRASYRGYSDPGDPRDSIGLRVVCVLA